MGGIYSRQRGNEKCNLSWLKSHVERDNLRETRHERELIPYKVIVREIFRRNATLLELGTFVRAMVNHPVRKQVP
jgi:hypothetical protein